MVETVNSEVRCAHRFSFREKSVATPNRELIEQRSCFPVPLYPPDLKDIRGKSARRCMIIMAFITILQFVGFVWRISGLSGMQDRYETFRSDPRGVSAPGVLGRCICFVPKGLRNILQAYEPALDSPRYETGIRDRSPALPSGSNPDLRARGRASRSPAQGVVIWTARQRQVGPEAPAESPKPPPESLFSGNPG